MLPPVSLPMEKPTRPAAVAAPGPALEPEAPSSSSHGFMVWPPNQMSLSASAPRLSLAIRTAPASSRRLTTAASSCGDAVAEGLGAVGGGDAGGVEQIFAAPGDAVQRAAIFSGGDFAVGLFGLREGEVARQGDDAAQLGIEAVDALEINVGEALGSELSRFDPARELGYGAKAMSSSRLGSGPGSLWLRNELVFFRDPACIPGQHGIPARSRGERWFERDFFGAGAAFVKRGHCAAPVARCLRALCCGEFDAYEFFGFHESFGRYFGAYCWSGAERGGRSWLLALR